MLVCAFSLAFKALQVCIFCSQSFTHGVRWQRGCTIGTWQSVTPRTLSALLSPPCGASRVGGARELVVSHHFAQTRCTTLARSSLTRHSADSFGASLSPVWGEQSWGCQGARGLPPFCANKMYDIGKTFFGREIPPFSPGCQSRREAHQKRRRSAPKEQKRTKSEDGAKHSPPGDLRQPNCPEGVPPVGVPATLLT